MKIKQRSQKKLNDNLRFQALIILDQIEHSGAYSNVLVNRFLSKSSFDARDNRLIVQLVYGVVQRRYTLNFYLEPFVKGKRIEPWVETLLRLSLYQLVYLDRIPAHAVINEAVSIAKINGHQGLGNFVNAILRNVQRKGLPELKSIKDPVNYLATKYSIDTWIIELLKETLAIDDIEKLLESLLTNAFVSARITGKPEQRESLIYELNEAGYNVESSPLSPYGIRSMDGNIISSKAFKEGKFTIQDESAMMVTPIGLIQGDEQILDACAAPGGKTTHMAQLLTSGHVTALDISANKLETVAEHIERMHLSDRVTLHAVDATKFTPENQQLYDKIYVDAPCSGLGLMRRKPEIKYEKSLKDIDTLKQIQLNILDHVSTLLKPKGQIIYSTCTITQQENEQVLDEFLRAHTSFVQDSITAEEVNQHEAILTPEGNVRIWPHQFNTDGFFISRLIKN